MKPSLQLRVGQHLALTPQLQQSIRLLQLSTLELQQEIEQVLAENPMLERSDDPLDACVRLAADGGLQPASPPMADAALTAPSPGPADAEPRAADAPADAAPATDFDGDGRADGDGLDWGGEGGRRRDDDDDERERPQLAGGGVTLREHLMAQLRSTRGSPRDRALVTLLIDELDEDGRLQVSLEEILEMLPAELEVDPSELSGALNLLQSFDPTGVGARSLSECLGLQMSAIPAGERPAPPVWAAARAIVSEHLPLLAARDHTRLKRHLRCDDETLRAAHALIRRLDPRPGSRFAGEDAGYVVPDVIVRRTRFGWQAFLNGDVMPRLRVNDLYAQILKRNRGSGAGGLSGQLQEARWLIKNVQQRFDTILRVSQAIVDRQKAFFTHGEVAMRPLILREIADQLGLHESTVSRVTTQKFMLTPFGTFELKYFFGSHVATESGGAASSTAIRALIRQLVAAEDPGAPLTDNRIADMLGEQGIVVARRTVAKYREALKIAPVSQRKAL